MKVIKTTVDNRLDKKADWNTTLLKYDRIIWGEFTDRKEISYEGNH